MKTERGNIKIFLEEEEIKILKQASDLLDDLFNTIQDNSKGIYFEINGLDSFDEVKKMKFDDFDEIIETLALLVDCDFIEIRG